METIPCPGCRTDLEPSATVCPICLRPRGKLEITRAYATLREMEKQRKKRPFVIAGRLAAAAAIGGVLFRFHAPIQNGASSASAFVTQFLNDSLYPAAPSAPPSAAPGSAAAAASPSPSDASSSLSAFPSAAALAAKPAQPSPAPAPAAAPPAPKRPARVEDLPFPSFSPTLQWVFYGRVFDLVTLLPVSGAQLTFGMASGGNNYALAGSAASDTDGRFSVALTRLQDGGSYEIHAARNGYASTVLYEADIPYAKLRLAERQGIVRNAQDGDMTLPPLKDITGEASMRRDIFLAPAR
jgi:hypothetical protein